MNTLERDRIRSIVQFAGGQYIGIRGAAVLFRDPISDSTMSLYLSAVTVETVRLSLKASREKILTTHEWVLTDAI